MRTFYSLTLAAALSAGTASAQTSDLVFFSDDGAKFTLIIDGDVKNASPASRVVATGIRNETPMCVARFEDKALGEVKQSTWFPAGKEYTVVITTNKKGVRVFRPQGEAELGTAAKAEPSEKMKPAEFVDDGAGATSDDVAVEQSMSVGGVQTTTTTTVTEHTGTDGENVNMSIGVNGVGINMNVNVDDNMGMEGGSTTTTTHTTTTTTTTSSSSGGTTAGKVTTGAAVSRPVEKEEPAAYSMPGYSGKVGCPWPMNPSEFNDAKTSITGKSFEDSKMTLAKQIAGDRCLTVDQVKGIMGLFSFEDSKLDFAKFAYDHTYDISNYYKVNDAFTFESSIDELNEYVRSR
jgi:hypothetical protein